MRMPNPSDYYNKDAARLVKEDYRKYLKMAKEDAAKKFKRI